MNSILIVDDEPVNHEVIEAFLEGEGYRLMHADSGEQAIAVARESPPDLVLLDVLMPGMNGFQTASFLKEQASSAYLPIILVSALADQSSRNLGLGTSADEYLTKPLDRNELVIRVRNLLLLRSQKSALLAQNIEQIELHRFKDEMSAMIVHDLKGPMAAVLLNLDFVLRHPENLDAEQLEALTDAHSGGKRALNIIHNLLDVTRIEGQRFALRHKPVNVSQLIGDILRGRSLEVRERKLSVVSRLDPGVEVQLDEIVMSRVVENILDNALRYTPVSGVLELSSEVVGSDLVLRIGNSGRAIDPAFRHQIFEKFSKASPNAGRMNLGLGLYFCRLAVEAHGGRISVEGTDALPTVFVMVLPLTSDGRQTATPATP